MANQPKKKKPGFQPAGARGKHGKLYFTLEHQNAIVEWQNATDAEIKNKLYTDKIAPALQELAHAVICTYKYSVTQEYTADLEQRCVEFLYTTLPKYDVTKGHKAFSFFNTVCRNWCTGESRIDVKRTKRHVSIDDENNKCSHADLEKIAGGTVPSPDESNATEETITLLRDLIDHLDGTVVEPKALAVLDALHILIANLDDIKILNARAVNLYIKEITGLAQKDVYAALNAFKIEYMRLKNIALNGEPEEESEESEESDEWDEEDFAQQSIN